MGLFSKEACTFCGNEVGMMHRSKLRSKEFICNDCRNKLNPFARMDYTDRAAAQYMMDNMGPEEAWLEAEAEKIEGRFDRGELTFTTFVLGSKRVEYRGIKKLGVFQIVLPEHSRYEHNAVLYFERLLPYEFIPEGDNFDVKRYHEMVDTSANYVKVEEARDPENKLTGCTVVIPYQDDCIREIRISADVRDESDKEGFIKFADRINSDRRNWINDGFFEESRKNRMQLRNLGDTAFAAAKAAIKGEDAADAVKEGFETAEKIEEGKVKQGLFGKLRKK